MDNQIKISEFVKLTRSTLKTVLYYHKIGLLPEKKLSSNGYRVYGAEDLERMRKINHLKNLGLDLKQIKEILGNINNENTLNEVLKSLQSELLEEKKNIEIQLSKIESLLKKEEVLNGKITSQSEIFQIVTDILEPAKNTINMEANPELFEQRNKVFGIIEDFQWGSDQKDNFKAIAEYFKANPEEYKKAIEFGKRLSALKNMSEDDPEIEALARDGAEFIKNAPFLKEMLYNKVGFGTANENLLNEMTKEVLSPAQMKHKELIQKYLNYRP